jgi:hypothetical protein
MRVVLILVGSVVIVAISMSVRQEGGVVEEVSVVFRGRQHVVLARCIETVLRA